MEGQNGESCRVTASADRHILRPLLPSLRDQAWSAACSSYQGQQTLDRPGNKCQRPHPGRSSVTDLGQTACAGQLSMQGGAGASLGKAREGDIAVPMATWGKERRHG